MATFFIVVASLAVALLLHRWFKRPSVKHIKGPPSLSFWLGHERVLHNQDNAGDLETKWRREYGTLFRIGGCFGFAILRLSNMFSTPHILTLNRRMPSSYWVSSPVGVLALLIILNPAFSPAQLRISQVIFQQCSDKLVNGIKESFTGTDDTVNIRDWTGKVTLDIIASFRYDFSTLDGQKTELGQAMRHLFTASQANPSALELILVAMIRVLPDSALGLLRLVPTREIRQLINVGNMAKKTARQIMASHNEVQTPEGNGDLLNILARARSAGKMQDDEIEAQLMTLIIAGHETSGTSLTWLLYELAVHSEYQSIIRAELNQSNEYDSMPFLNAVIKESLRLHPVVHSLMRTAPHDDIIPLSGGKTLTIPKGQTLLCSAYLYNRLPCHCLWGDDAEEWNPARFLDKTLPVSMGVYAKLE
ncbi:cytochrome P450 [Armillaria gallica]|uniref:Cytochrome P450 n=1 Tax=Armillaria gallica TaxID=47427 RepID=A0A2H3DJT0_ARMGA|nr:cytochrome P450 [Armillaria gallica]